MPIQSSYIRYVLWVSVFFNVGGAWLFAFPDSSLGQLVQLPLPVPGIYSATLAFFVLLFGAMYAWLALQTTIYRPLLAFLAAGKLGAFIIVFLFWFSGAAPFRGLLAASGDLLLALNFIAWLSQKAQSRSF